MCCLVTSNTTVYVLVELSCKWKLEVGSDCFPLCTKVRGFSDIQGFDLSVFKGIFPCPALKIYHGCLVFFRQHCFGKAADFDSLLFKVLAWQICWSALRSVRTIGSLFCHQGSPTSRGAFFYFGKMCSSQKVSPVLRV